MNLITYLSELEEQIKSYKEFIPLTNDNDSMLILMREIYRLILLTDKIKELNFNELTIEFEVEIKQRSSRINYAKSGI